MITSENKKVFLVTGCPRSGTTALVHLLNCHPDVAVSNERFSKRVSDPDFDVSMFDAPRYSQFVDGDTYPAAFDSAATQNAMAKHATAMAVGDKIPNPAEVVAASRALGGVPVIAIVREPRSVAHSYEGRRTHAKNNPDVRGLWPDWRDHRAAVKEFNEAVAVLRDAASGVAGQEIPILLLRYEELFSGQMDYRDIFRFLGVDPDRVNNAESILDGRDKSLMQFELIDQYVAANANYADYRALLDMGAEEGSRRVS